MTNKTFKRYRKRVSRFTSWISVLTQEIESATTRELNYVLKHKDSLTNTNCAWYHFRGMKIIVPMIEEELKRRKHQKTRKQ